MARVLVCGGAGYIGSHMCKMLAKHGHKVAVIDNFSTGHRAAARYGQLYEGDLNDGDLLARTFADFRPEAVMHFAAKSIVPESVSDPAAYYHNNVTATLRLLEFVRRDQCPFVFSSTAAVYGIPQTELIDEAHPCKPINPYGATKLAVERALADYWQAYRLPSASFRYFNAAGADPSGEIGEAHMPETHLIPRILESALGRLPAIKVFGADYPTRDGTCVRDYIHVSDLCDAHLRGLDGLLNKPDAKVFNLGNGDGYTVREVFDAAERVTGRRIPHELGPRRAGDPPMLVAHAKRANAELGWTPLVTSLESMIETAWRWHRSRRY